MITVKFNCKMCGVNEYELQVPAREAEEVQLWIDKTLWHVAEEHHRISPLCPSIKCDLIIPTPTESEFVGQQVE
jgi:hypothetical protein